MHKMRKVRKAAVRNLGVLAFVALLVSVSAGAGGAEVANELIKSLTEGPTGLPELMQQFVSIVDGIDNPDERLQFLENPNAWFEDEDRGVELGDAVFWAVDLTKLSEEGEPWLPMSTYRGDSDLQTVGVVLGVDRLSMFIRVASVDPTTGRAAEDLTQETLAAISWRSDEGWQGLLDVVLAANAPSEEDLRQQLLLETRATLIRNDLDVSAAEAQLSVLDHAGAEAAEALHFGPIPDGMVLTPQAITVFGETVWLVYNRLF